jgi:hypothetical protein
MVVLSEWSRQPNFACRAGHLIARDGLVRVPPRLAVRSRTKPALLPFSIFPGRGDPFAGSHFDATKHCAPFLHFEVATKTLTVASIRREDRTDVRTMSR